MISRFEVRAAGAVAAVLPALAFGALAQVAPGVTWRHMANIKAGVAVAGAAVLLWTWIVHREGRPGSFARTRDALLLALGILAGLGWWNLGLFHRDHYVHEWDTYHYYLGAKYFPELGYTRLYLCTVVADAEEGRLEPGGNRTARDLATNRLVTAESLAADPAQCTAHFGPARWAAFKRDLEWFRQAIGRARWPLAQRDHGFNATPVWLLLGRSLASTGPVSSTQILALALIDPLLLLGMWAAVWWTFGWRATCIALLFWGTNYPAYWGWTGGGYLRHDWLLLSVLGLVLVKRRHMASAGAALAVAGLLRVFPWVLLGGIVLKVLWQVAERRSLAPLAEYRRFATGFALAALVLVPAATLTSGGGWGVWPAFIANSAKHSSTPSVNYIGLKSVLSYSHDLRVERLRAHGLEEDVFRIWREARVRVFSERRPLFLAATVALIALIGAAVRRQPDWVAAAMGIGLIPVLTEVSCYYYSIFLAFGLLGVSHRAVAVALVGLAAVTCVFQRFDWLHDTRFAAISAAVLAFVIFAGATTWLSRASAATVEPTGN